MRSLSSRALCEGFCFLEAPRIHESGLLVSDVYGAAVYLIDANGAASKIADVPGHPSGLGRLPNGTWLVVVMLEKRLAGHREAIIWPEKSADIPDRDPSFLVAYLPLEFGTKPRTAQEEAAKDLLAKSGDRPRQYRNGLGLAIPSSDQIEILRRSVLYLMATEEIKSKAKKLNLTDEQRSQVREREATEEAAVESAFLKLYKVEKSLDLAKISAEQRKILKDLSEKLSKDDLIALLQDCLLFRLGRLEYSEFYASLKDRCRAAGIPVSSELSKYIEYVAGTEAIQQQALLKEMSQLENETWTTILSFERRESREAGRPKSRTG